MRFKRPREARSKTQALLSVVAACGSENNFVDSRGFRKRQYREALNSWQVKEEGFSRRN